MNSEVTLVYSGTTYQYMLALDKDGQKKWDVQPLFRQPPSLLRNKIDLTIKAAPSMRDLNDVVYTTRDITTVLAELRVLTDGDTITLTGFDAGTYYVTFDPNAAHIRSIMDEAGRITEYEIDISCWDLYQT